MNIPKTYLVCSGNESNTGKSTIAKNLLVPQLKKKFDDVKYVTIEAKEREGSGEDAQMTPAQVSSLITEIKKVKLSTGKALVVEVGAQLFNSLMGELENNAAHGFTFEIVVYPITDGVKLKYTAMNITRLVGDRKRIDPRNIRVILNKVDWEQKDKGFFELRKKKPDWITFEEAMTSLGVMICESHIMQNEIYPTLDSLEQTRSLGLGKLNVPELAKLGPDHFVAAGMKAEEDGDTEIANELFEMDGYVNSAMTIIEQYDEVVRELLPELA